MVQTPNPEFYHAAQDVFHKLRTLVENPPSQDAAAATAAHIQGMALIGRLKSLNRTANAATRLKKDATAEARTEMDQSHLGLQNLLYEKRHLEREIERCRQFASNYQDVPLHGLDEFKRIAPEESRIDEVLADEHQLMIHRLTFELSERRRLDQKKRELLKQKEDLIKESKTKAIVMDNVKSQIDALVKTATDIQKKVDDLVQPIASQDTSAHS